MKKIGLILSVLVVALCASCSKSSEGEYTITSSLEINAPSLPQEAIKALEIKYTSSIKPVTGIYPTEDMAKAAFDNICDIMLAGMQQIGTIDEFKTGEYMTISMILHRGDAKGSTIKVTKIVGTNTGWEFGK